MKVRDLAMIIFDKVTIYKSSDDGFVDLYKGEVKNIPPSILDKEIGSIGASRKGFVDIRVQNTPIE